MVNSKNKGNTFERKIANVLSDRFQTVLGLKKAFRRSVDSGSFFGGKNQSRVTTHDLSKANFGDLMCPENFNYSIECKHYKDAPTLGSLLDGSIKDWDKWIAQASQDCRNSGKKMAIIIKYNNQKEIVIVESVPPEVACAVKYQDCAVIPLAVFLAMDDREFFTLP
jgi:hypothetical protein